MVDVMGLPRYPISVREVPDLHARKGSERLAVGSQIKSVRAGDKRSQNLGCAPPAAWV